MASGTCSHELRTAGKAYPRTCSICGLGPCSKERAPLEPAQPRDAAGWAIEIAATVFPHNLDRQRRDELTVLLASFAAEIRRSAIEP